MENYEVPAIRVRALNDLSARADGDFVLYWMTAFRRTDSNFALQHAVNWAAQLQRPLLVLEALRSDYHWACDRFHRFVIEGMRDNAAAFEKSPISYYPYVEPATQAGRGLIEQLSLSASVCVSDDFPCFFHPGMYRRLAEKIQCRFELVDANCLMPLAAADRTFTVAHSYRRWMQKILPAHLDQPPQPQPLGTDRARRLVSLKAMPQSISKRWPRADLETVLSDNGLAKIPIAHEIGAVPMSGGAVAARKLLGNFVRQRLGSYDADRNEPDLHGSTELSGHLHFGHIGPHEIFDAVMANQEWHPGKLSKPNGKVNGFWGVGGDAEALLDQLCTWREIGFNMCWRQPNYDKYDSLPTWARQTMREHAKDRRPYLYTLQQFESAQTHDPIWNAAQRQLVREGRIHNYLRMLWGKKILHWTKSPEQALEWMIDLNNKYAIDGRDPNSYSGIFWVLGRYDRAWGPEREVFGKIRYMTSENTAKKHHLRQYLRRFAADHG